MKVLFAFPSTHLAGTERATLELMLLLRERGHDCRVYALRPFGALKPILDMHGFAAEALDDPGRYGWRTFFALRRHVRAVKPDALMLCGVDPDALLAVRTLREVPRRVLSMHWQHRGDKSAFYWTLSYRIALGGVDAITYCSDYTRGEAESYVPALRPLGTTLYNPVPVHPLSTQEQRRTARTRLGLPQDVFMVGCAGRMVPIKRFDVFLDTAARIAAADASARFLLAGGGPEEAALRTRMQRLGLSERTHWLGWIPDMEDFYRAVDVQCFHSDAEPFGLSAAEAMARGVPVVASVIQGGLHELINSPQVGTCLREHDAEALAGAVLALRGAQGREVGLAGQARLAQLCSPARAADVMEQMLGLRDDAIRSQHPAAR